MCQICADFQKGKMTLKEAAVNFSETDWNQKHVQEFIDKLDHDDRFDFIMSLYDREQR